MTTDLEAPALIMAIEELRATAHENPAVARCSRDCEEASRLLYAPHVAPTARRLESKTLNTVQEPLFPANKPFSKSTILHISHHGNNHLHRKQEPESAPTPPRSCETVLFTM